MSVVHNYSADKPASPEQKANVADLRMKAIACTVGTVFFYLAAIVLAGVAVMGILPPLSAGLAFSCAMVGRFFAHRAMSFDRQAERLLKAP